MTNGNRVSIKNRDTSVIRIESPHATDPEARFVVSIDSEESDSFPADRRSSLQSQSRLHFLCRYFRSTTFRCSNLNWIAVAVVIVVITMAIVVGKVVSDRRTRKEKNVYCSTITGKKVFEDTNAVDIRIEVLESCIAGAYIISALTSALIWAIMWHKKKLAREGDFGAGKYCIML